MIASARGHEDRATAAPHAPVLLRDVMDALAPRDGGIYVDGTFGAGGYARAMLSAAHTRVIGIDRDPSAVATGQALAAEAPGRFRMVEGCFGDMDGLVPPVLADWNRATVDGIALDLGVSSMQLDQAERGFSFRFDGPLDMRMDGGAAGTPSAAEVVNTYEDGALARLFRVLGEERQAGRVARAIVRRRAEVPFERTADLAGVVAAAVGGKPQRIHPATRVFQALRIHVNDELGELARGLAAAEALLGEGGRLAVVSFHSLEDRIVKKFLTARTGAGPRPSRHLPEAAQGPAPTFRPVGNPGGAAAGRHKSVEPSAAEIDINPRARSARLRAAERTDAPALPLDMAALGVPFAGTGGAS